ncbi:DUF6625 family protein, partial [Lactobacillus delbrueckii subsp. bulgaricus]|nr:hypothetical protein [Lactobacillus delbrueckii subsp. bulgaricus]
ERPGEYCHNYDQQIFYYHDGKVLRDFVENGQIKTDELMYIHLQKRKMLKPDFNPNKHDFYITNGRFIEKTGPTTLKIIEQYNKKSEISAGFHATVFEKDARFYWLGRRWMNFRAEVGPKVKSLLKGKNNEK